MIELGIIKNNESEHIYGTEGKNMLEEKVGAFLKQHSITFSNKNILVGVSGGPDSLALLHYLWNQRGASSFTLMAAHVDHMFRGEESRAEAHFVRRFCEAREIPFAMTTIDVPAYMESTGKSTQMAARECRYTFFGELMEEHRFDYLALGHHGDDQVETILMRLTRGSTGAARAGIGMTRPFHSGQILRPFLCLERQDIESYCQSHHLDPRRDPSNEKEHYIRNRFRKRVLPFLKEENNRVHEHFQRFSEEIREDEAYLQELTIAKMNTVMDKKTNQEIILHIIDFLTLPIPLQRRGIQLILNYLYNDRPSSLSAVHIESVFSLIRSPHPSGTIHFPNGLQITRSYEECSFSFRQTSVQPYRFELNEPGQLELPGGSKLLMAYTDNLADAHHAHTIVLNCDHISLPLIVRTRQKGDRMSLRGMTGTKKLKDIFIDKKIPLQERDTWPIVTDGNGQILWVAGLKKYNEAAQEGPNARYILIKYSK